MRELGAEHELRRHRPHRTAPIAPVLCYHAVGHNTSSAMAPYTTTPETLAHHVTLLREQGYELVTCSRLAAEVRAGLPRPVAAITFDDALGSFVDVALPLLQALDVPVTMYVPTGWVGVRAGWMGAPERVMTWAELRDLDAAGVELGAHGHHHCQLDVTPGAGDDIRTSKQILEDGLQHTVRSFAYPYGAYDEAVRRAVEHAGFESAAAVKHAWSHAGTDPYAIARVLVRHSHDRAWLEHRLRRRRPLDPVGELVRTSVHRRWRRRRARANRSSP